MSRQQKLSPLLTGLLVLLVINSSLELQVAVPNFNDITHYFSASHAEMNLTSAYNLLGFCIAAMIYGPLSENYGRRKIMLIGNALFFLGAVACVFATSFDVLLVARFIEGLGAATSAVIVAVIIADTCSRQHAISLYGILNAGAIALIAFSSALDSVINKYVGWRGNYASTAIMCAIGLILVYYVLPETQTKRQAFNLQKSVKDFFQLLTSLKFLSAATVPSLLYAAYLIFIACAPSLYMETYHLSVWEYTVHQILLISIFLVSSVVAGKTIELIGAIPSLWAGLIFTGGSVGVLIALSFTPTYSSYAITGLMSLFCIGFSILYPLVFAPSLEIYPQLRGTASSAITSMRYLFCSILIEITGYIYNGNVTQIATILGGIMAVNLILSLYLQWAELFHPYPQGASQDHIIK